NISYKVRNMENKKLAKTEMRILAQLDMNARIRFRRMGKKIRKSEQSISYVVNSLMRRGVIKNFYTLMDYSRLSVLNFRVFFKINYISEYKFKELVDFLVNEPHTLWVATCGGNYDLICTFGAFNPSQFNKLLRKIIADFNEQMQSYTILTTIVIRQLGRRYLSDNRELTIQRIVGGDREPYQLPEKDIRLLAEIADNPRKSSVEIGKEISCNARTVINRLKVLKSMEVIKGFRTFLDLSDLGYVTNLLMIKYHNISVEDEKRLVEYLVTHPNIVCVTKTLGEWDLEIRIEVEDVRDFRKIERGIREKFSEMIQHTGTIPIYMEHKKTFFPRFILEKSK
ncbi:MAG: Lrp/AsnC family transcriptional regulator, partial [Candidatus Aenigmarchaeota archaeon]